ncbi:MAG TPA: hypothetical protein VH120_00750, partial [Gemmataceae bacterium]|nr:hypothetical protein [Gemmataceae bacterium]
MTAIRIQTTLTSETLNLPELKPWIGRSVEIIVLDTTDDLAVRPPTVDWETAKQAAQRLRESGFDFDAYREQREFDQEHAEDHLR